MRILLPLIAVSACKFDQPADWSSVDCITTVIPADADDEHAFDAMASALDGEWSVPWDDGPADFGTTLTLSGGIETDSVVVETRDSGSGNCPTVTQVRRVYVEGLRFEASWLGGAISQPGFYLEAVRAPDAVPTLVGGVDVDQPSAAFEDILLDITEGGTVQGTRWNFFYGSSMSVDFTQSDGTAVSHLVASCDPGDVEPL